MGRFKFSDLMMNTLFCKFKRQDGDPIKETQNASAAAGSTPDTKRFTCNARKSYYFTRGGFRGENFTTTRPDPPRKSGRRRSGRRSPRSSPRMGCGCRERVPLGKAQSPVYPMESSDDTEPWGPLLPESRFDSRLRTESSDGPASWATGSGSSSSNSLNLVYNRPEPGGDFLPRPELPRIVTTAGGNKTHTTKRSPRLLFHSPGVRLRVNSPRLGHNRRTLGQRGKSTSSKSLRESFAMVTSSENPMEDFRESMTEMIVHNNISNSDDLEELLACYLSLNSNNYHHLIISAFKQIYGSI